MYFYCCSWELLASVSFLLVPGYEPMLRLVSVPTVWESLALQMSVEMVTTHLFLAFLACHLYMLAMFRYSGLREVAFVVRSKLSFLLWTHGLEFFDRRQC